MRFSSRRLRQLISTLHPSMIFLSRASSSSSSMRNINGGGMRMLKSKSEENLSKLSDCMDNMDEDVSKLFIECHQTDFRKDPELLLLLNEYFTTSKKVSELCECLRNCLENIQHDECVLLDESLRDFEEEKKSYGESLQPSFRKTTQDLRNFTALHQRDYIYDVISGDFLKKIQTCHQDLGNMMVKLETTMKKIDKKLRRVRGIRVVVAAALLASVIAIVSLSKFVAGIFGSVPVEPITTFVASKWKKSTETLKREKIAMTTMEREMMVALKDVEKISILVARLEAVERSIRVTAELAVKKKSVPLAMTELEKERKSLSSTLVDLDRETGRCDGFVQFGRSLARDKIFEFLSHGQKKSD
ncbi:hypothetical protein EUTSA_v10027573mg [Eutrema salsugineum]|uniref:Uncharacterized protein n=1 Tax=Eutrema salsugineum TaxID=72664 RepID=V4LS73_EUTSA|nr:UPF0496 protein At3g57100 [Eutrema salsugineum]ESQ53455.1 hypothetical protein EUTSA_v10027573mg [Eutrema salsugineum]